MRDLPERRAGDRRPAVATEPNRELRVVKIGASSARRLGPRGAFWSSLIVFVLLGGLWAVATPLAASPDEPAHMAKAAGVVRGQVIGGEWAPGQNVLALPQLYQDYHAFNDCFGFRPDISAACTAMPSGDRDETVAVLTTAGRYNPLYYAIVGLASWFPTSITTFYLVRMASVLLCAWTLALAVRSAVEVRKPTWLLVGVAAATTPMVVFLLGVVNPSTIEITAGIALWTTLLAAIRDPRPELVGRRMWRAGLLVALLVNAKALSPVFLAIIVLAVIAVGPWQSTVRVVRDRRSWPGLAVGTLASAAAVAWLWFAGAVAERTDPPFPDLTPVVALDAVIRRADQYLVNMFGQFGLVDTNMPIWTYVLLGAGIGLPIVLALALADRRERSVLLVLGAVTVAMPIALQVPAATMLGLPWQGRYVLPVAVGLPLLSGFVLARHHEELGALLTRRSVVVLAAGGAFIQVVAFVTALRRYTVGIEWPYFSGSPEVWEPPGGAGLLVGSVIVVCAAGAWLLVHLARSGEPASAQPERATGESTP